jgi:transposase
VPWARAGAGHTCDFDQQVAWNATHMAKTAVVELIRIAWRTVGAIIDRYWQDVEDCFDRYAGLKRIGIDEIAYKKGHKFLTIVVDHDTGRLVWAGPGRDATSLTEFFDLLGPARCAQIALVSADTARYIAAAVKHHLPGAVMCTDPFHVVARATDALDLERRAAWNRAPGRARETAITRVLATGHAQKLKGARRALWKNPENLTANQRATLEWIAQTDPHLHQAYLLKEGLRHVFKLKGTDGVTALEAWLARAKTSTITAFHKLARTIEIHRATINAAPTHRLPNTLTESINTKIRHTIRTAYGFHHPDALITLAPLTHGGHRPTLPSRNQPTETAAEPKNGKPWTGSGAVQVDAGRGRGRGASAARGTSWRHQPPAPAHETARYSRRPQPRLPPRPRTAETVYQYPVICAPVILTDTPQGPACDTPTSAIT